MSKAKCDNPLCSICYPEDWNPEPEPEAWAWPWGLALLVLLFVWAAWFVNSGAVRP